MPDCLRAWHAGGTYFLTVNALQRQGNKLLVPHVCLLCDVLQEMRGRHRFAIDGWANLPEHMHCVIELPPEDSNFALRGLQKPMALKAQFFNASILKDGRVVFNIAGNKYRLVVWINYPYRVVYIRFIVPGDDAYREHLIRDKADWSATWIAFIPIPSSMGM